LYLIVRRAYSCGLWDNLNSYHAPWEAIEDADVPSMQLDTVRLRLIKNGG
jgi:hypothetical protein